MMISVNGPEVVFCDSVVEEALKLYLEKAKRDGESDGFCADMV